MRVIRSMLETPNKFGTPGTLTNGITKQHMYLVTIKNMRPESNPPNPNSPLGPPVSFFEVQMDEDSGYHLIFAPIFGTMATQLKSYWGVLRSPKLSQQISRSKAMYRQMEKLAVHPKERELLEQRRHQYTYDIGRSHIIVLGPNGE